jgi:hypothetical protein
MRHHRAFALLAVALLGVAACSDDDDTAADPFTAAEEGVLVIELSDFAFGPLPETVPAGTKLAIENTAATELTVE